MTCRNAIGIAQNDAREGQPVEGLRPANPCGVLPCESCDDGLLYYSQSERRWLECALCGEDA